MKNLFLILWFGCVAPLVACTESNDEERDDTQETGDTDTAETGDTDILLVKCGEDLEVECNSLFAARIFELQCEANPEHLGNCTTPLSNDIGFLNDAADPLCIAGESPDACQERLYDTPPDPSTLKQGNCSGETCMQLKALPKCADGSDTCASPEVICQDGTRPMAYMASGEASNTWVFHMGGEGGPCAGELCWALYRYSEDMWANGEFERAMSAHHPMSLTTAKKLGSGLTNGDPAVNPLGHANRVKWKRCSDSASDGIHTTPLFSMSQEVDQQVFLSPGLPDEATRWGTAPVYHHGLKTWQGLFYSLTTDTGRDLNGDGVPDLPSLNTAETVVLAGSSDASLWLTVSADAFRDTLRDIAGSDVDVRLLIDGFYEPMLDNEMRYQADASEAFSVFSDGYETGAACRLPDDGGGDATCSNNNFTEEVTDFGKWSVYGAMAERNTTLDASCEALHGADAWQCYDIRRVLSQNVDTPYMVIADQQDFKIAGSSVPFADRGDYGWPSLEQYRRRVLDQANDIHRNGTTSRREEGAKMDMGQVFILRRSPSNNHTHFGDNAKMGIGSPDTVGQWAMTRCTRPSDSSGLTLSNLQLIDTWLKGTLPVSLISEDASRWDGASPFWVSGATCRTPQ